MPLSPEIQIYVDQGRLTLAQAKGLKFEGRLNLGSLAIRGLIADGTLTLAQAIRLNINEHQNLESPPIRGLIADGILTLAQALGLTINQRLNLESLSIRGLVADGILTLEQALGLGYQGLTALDDEDTRQRLRNGELTIQNILGQQRPLGGQGIPAPVHVNDSQSTHTASVHKTASESAARLLQRFPQIRNPRMLAKLNTCIKTFIAALPNDKLRNEAAKRCVLRLAAPDHIYTDPASGVTTLELLALSWLAIHDEAMRTSSLEDATRLFIEGLYEIQRGYNLSDTGSDLMGADVYICSGGSFNKLLEKLNGVHPCVAIEVITPTLAAFKFPIVVNEEVKNYLAARANPNTYSEFRQFTHLIKQIEAVGVEVIWEAIQARVTTRMFDEFGSLYTGQDDPHFLAFIDAGKYVALGELPSFQKQVLESEGYRKYCSSIMKSHLLFSSSRSPSVYVAPVFGQD